LAVVGGGGGGVLDVRDHTDHLFVCTNHLFDTMTPSTHVGGWRWSQRQTQIEKENEREEGERSKHKDKKERGHLWLYQPPPRT
jgi:hypothetical protein